MPRTATKKTIEVPTELYERIVQAAKAEADRLDIPKMSLHVYLRRVMDKVQ